MPGDPSARPTMKVQRLTATLAMNASAVQAEIERICRFIGHQAGDDPVLVGVSGGIDSDVCARLCARSVGGSRLKLVVVLQADMDGAHASNAHELSEDLHVRLVTLRMVDEPQRLVSDLRSADPDLAISPDDLLDVGKSKNSLRTWVKSMYAEKGYLVVGTANRTELETGFYLPFGDGLAHIHPIGHLYKTQVRQVAKALSTRDAVMTQQPSAGYWRGETDLEDLAYWLHHGKPVSRSLQLADEELGVVSKIRRQLSFEAIDTALLLLHEHQHLPAVSEASGLDMDLIRMLSKLVQSAKTSKGRPLNRTI